MLNTKLGFFYVHQSACRFIYEIVEVYLYKQIRLSFPHFYNALRGLYCDTLASTGIGSRSCIRKGARELAFNSQSITVYENKFPRFACIYGKAERI